MILYATTTTERASKGQGGNDRLYIDVNMGNLKEVVTVRINKSPTLKAYILSVEIKTGNGVKKIEELFYSMYEETKGNKKKDDIYAEGHKTLSKINWRRQ